MTFADIGWDDYILSPKGFWMNFCKGECMYPLSDNMNATNHAVFQQLYNRIGKLNRDKSKSRNQRAIIPPPCCVPTEFNNLTVLYIVKKPDKDEQSDYGMKVFNDMEATACGCH